MLSLTRAIAWRVPLVTFRVTAPITLQRSPFVSLSSYRGLATSSSLFAAARVTATSRASKTAGRTKAKPKATAKSKSKTQVKKAKPKVKAKAKAKPKRKVAAKAKPKVSTRVPLAQRPPRRPLTPFLLFYKRTYPSPGSRPGGIMSASKDAAEAWHNLPDKEKQSFHEEAKNLVVDYITIRDKWYQKPENLQILRTLNKDRKKRGKQRILVPSTAVPKRPLTSFMRFAQELRDTHQLSHNDAPKGTNTSPVTWAARESGARWNALPAAEKEKYAKAYQADLAKWKVTTATATA